MENNNIMQQIIVKKKEYEEVSKRYKEDIEFLKWQYLKVVYGLHKGCVCSLKGDIGYVCSLKGHIGYVVLMDIAYFSENRIELKFKNIKTDGNISLRGIDCSVDYVLKEFDTYAEYKNALNSL